MFSIWGGQAGTWKALPASGLSRTLSCPGKLTRGCRKGTLLFLNVPMLCAGTDAASAHVHFWCRRLPAQQRSWRCFGPGFAVVLHFSGRPSSSAASQCNLSPSGHGSSQWWPVGKERRHHPSVFCLGTQQTACVSGGHKHLGCYQLCPTTCLLLLAPEEPRWLPTPPAACNATS